MVYFFLGTLLGDSKHELVIGELDAAEEAVVDESTLQGIDIIVVADNELIEERLVVDEGEVACSQEVVTKIMCSCIAQLSSLLQSLFAHE